MRLKFQKYCQLKKSKYLLKVFMAPTNCNGVHGDSSSGKGCVSLSSYFFIDSVKQNKLDEELQLLLLQRG